MNTDYIPEDIFRQLREALAQGVEEATIHKVGAEVTDTTVTRSVSFTMPGGNWFYLSSIEHTKKEK